MVVIEPSGAFDMWTLLVELVFGSFWITVFGLMLVMFIIMGWLGKMSIYSCTWYMAMFLICMTMGYGFIVFNLLISLMVIIAFMYSIKGYIERGGQ